MSYIQRAINVTISLGQGNFGESGFNTITLTGLRVSATIQKYGAPSFNQANIRIFGMTLSQMNSIATAWLPFPEFRNNVVSIQAGDAVSGMPVAYEGGIRTAWANLQAQPDASFDITAMTSYLSAMQPVQAISYPGPTDAAVILSGMAAQMGLNFENNGVSRVMLSSPYFAGTGRQQAINCAHAAGIEIGFDDTTLAIWPKGGSRNGTPPLISPATGLVGYPVYNGSGISLKTLYNPAIRFGGQIQVQSSIPAACGVWTVWKMTHTLESQMPGGAWFTDLEGMVAT